MKTFEEKMGVGLCQLPIKKDIVWRMLIYKGTSTRHYKVYIFKSLVNVYIKYLIFKTENFCRYLFSGMFSPIKILPEKGNS